MRSSKGGHYEREIARRLSLWWTDGARDDVFWRVGGSGGRAKGRGRKGVGTAGQHGDIAATDPIGAPLIDALTIEIKRGYSKNSFVDVIDRPVRQTRSQQIFDKWVQQIIESWEQSGSFSWLLITKRDGREPLVVFPHYLASLIDCTSWIHPNANLSVDILLKKGTKTDFRPLPLQVTTLEVWLKNVTPKMIKALDI